METQTLFTAQELFRKQLLLNTKCEPLKSASQIHRIVQQKATGVVKTGRGLIKVLTIDEINKHNEDMKQLLNRTFISLTQPIEPPTGN